MGFSLHPTLYRDGELLPPPAKKTGELDANRAAFSPSPAHSFRINRLYIFCGTFHITSSLLAIPRVNGASRPTESGLSSPDAKPKAITWTRHWIISFLLLPELLIYLLLYFFPDRYVQSRSS